MSAKRMPHGETGVEEVTNSEDTTDETCLTTKLQRRRRIEDINEERRLQKELSEFS